jgi:D-sedoheptulose 7-phosphate isomerase
MDRVTTSEARRATDSAVSAHLTAVNAVGAMDEAIAQAASIMADALAAGGKLLVCGNGGSAAEAQHMAAEMVGRYLKERPAWSAIALSMDSSAVTAIGNDYGFDRVFARQIEAHGRAGDVVVAFSTSGTSPNILAAIDAARERGLKVIGLAGEGGGAMAACCDAIFAVPSSSTPRIQEVHTLLVHLLCGLVEDALT